MANDPRRSKRSAHLWALSDAEFQRNPPATDSDVVPRIDFGRFRADSVAA